MSEKTESLEYLRMQLECSYISGLKFLSRRKRKCLIREIDKIPAKEFSQWEWNDALEYLANGHSKLSVEEAKTEFLNSLKRFY